MICLTSTATVRQLLEVASFYVTLSLFAKENILVGHVAGNVAGIDPSRKHFSSGNYLNQPL